MIVDKLSNHSNPIERRDQIISGAAFFFLFPGFFYYHTLLGTGAINAFLGGYFSPISLILFIPLMTIAIQRYREVPIRMSSIEIHYIIFLAFFLAIIACNSYAHANSAIVVNHLLCIIFMINAFIIFNVINFELILFRILAIISLSIISGIAFNYSLNGVFYLGALGIARDADSLATYQGFARSYLITFLPVIAFTHSLIARFFLYVLATSTLFVNTARSEFVALIFIIPIIEFYFSKQKILFIFSIILLCIFLDLHVGDFSSLLPDNRILELLDLSQSTSANKRHHLTEYALQTILAHPVLGDYASYSPGYYSHNILSAWVDLGIFGFLYLIGILCVPAIPMFLQEHFAGRRCKYYILGFSMVCCTSLLLVTAHYFTDMLIGATLGVYSQYRYWKKRGCHLPPNICSIRKDTRILGENVT